MFGLYTDNDAHCNLFNIISMSWIKPEVRNPLLLHGLHCLGIGRRSCLFSNHLDNECGALAILYHNLLRIFTTFWPSPSTHTRSISNPLPYCGDLLYNSMEVSLPAKENASRYPTYYEKMRMTVMGHFMPGSRITTAKRWDFSGPKQEGKKKRVTTILATPWNYLVRLKGFEPLTYGLEVRCSIQLSYRRICIP